MFSINLVTWLTRAFELIWLDDVCVTENDCFTTSLAGTIADALTAAVVERKAGASVEFHELLPDFRTVVRALRAVERGQSYRDQDASAAVLALGVFFEVEGAAKIETEILDAEAERITARVLARAELGLSDKTDW